MSPFDRSCTTSCQSAIVSLALSWTIFEMCDVMNIVTLKSRLEVSHPANLCTTGTSLKATDQGPSFCRWKYASIFVRFYTASSEKCYI